MMIYFEAKFYTEGKKWELVGYDENSYVVTSLHTTDSELAERILHELATRFLNDTQSSS